MSDYLSKVSAQGQMRIADVKEAAEFFTGMLLHQWYLEQLYLTSDIPSDAQIEARASAVIDRFLGCYSLPANIG